MFSSLDEEQLDILVKAMFECHFQAGDVVIREGDEGDNFYIVESGVCQVFVNSAKDPRNPEV